MEQTVSLLANRGSNASEKTRQKTKTEKTKHDDDDDGNTLSALLIDSEVTEASSGLKDESARGLESNHTKIQRMAVWSQ